MKEKNDNIKLKISIKLNNYKYSPSEEVEGVLTIIPNKNIKLSNILQYSDLIIILQEKIAYKYTVNDHQTYIIDKKFLKFDNYKNIDNKKYLKVPIKYKIPDISTKNFYPSFRYFSDDIKCIISHSLCIEIPFLSNKTSVNIFIRKIPLEKIDNKENSKELDKNIFSDEFIKKYFLINTGRLSYFIRTKKSISYKERFPIEIHIDERELGEDKIESVDMKIVKHIYLYNELNIYTDSLEICFDMKKIILNKNKNIKNNTILENFELPSTEFIPISASDIHKIDLSDSKFNFTPPVKNILFKCEYELQITFNFNSNFIQDKIVNVPIDYYDPEYDNKIIKAKENEKDYNIIGLKKEINENNNKNINVKNNKNNKNINNNKFNIFSEFVDISQEDFIKMIDGNDL